MTSQRDKTADTAMINDLNNNNMVLDRKSPSSYTEKRSHYSRPSSPKFIARASPIMKDRLSPTSPKSPPRSPQITAVENKKLKTSPTTTKTNEENVSSALDMLTRLFPHHSSSMLKTVLVTCNKDPVRTIEKLLDRVPAEVTKKELSLSMRRASSLSPVGVHSVESSIDKKQNYNNLGINDDQLSSLAKAYDIPVNEEKVQRKSLAW